MGKSFFDSRSLRRFNLSGLTLMNFSIHFRLNWNPQKYLFFCYSNTTKMQLRLGTNKNKENFAMKMKAIFLILTFFNCIRFQKLLNHLCTFSNISKSANMQNLKIGWKIKHFVWNIKLSAILSTETNFRSFIFCFLSFWFHYFIKY